MRSTITIADREFPTVALICPPSEGQDDESDWDRALGAGGNDEMRFIPLQNGLLVEVEPDKKGTWTVSLRARTCYPSPDSDGDLWLPHHVGLADGDLVTGDQSAVDTWWRAEGDWVVETIDRVTVKPFVQPDGPAVELVDADRFEGEAREASERAESWST